MIDEETAPVVRNIFKWASDGMGDMRITQKLNELGIPFPSQYRYTKGILKSGRYANVRYWYKSAVRRILINPVYLGHLVQSKTKTTMGQWGLREHAAGAVGGNQGPTGATGPANITPVQTTTPLALTLGVTTPVLTLAAITTTAGQNVKLDSMAEVDITTSSTGNYQYTIVYNLLRSGVIISSVTIDKDDDSTGATRLYGEIPNMTWVDTPGAGTFTYSVDITVTGTNIASASTITLALNAIVIG